MLEPCGNRCTHAQHNVLNHSVCLSKQQPMTLPEEYERHCNSAIAPVNATVEVQGT